MNDEAIARCNQRVVVYKENLLVIEWNSSNKLFPIEIQYHSLGIIDINFEIYSFEKMARRIMRMKRRRKRSAETNPKIL